MERMQSAGKKKKEGEGGGEVVERDYKGCRERRCGKDFKKSTALSHGAPPTQDPDEVGTASERTLITAGLSAEMPSESALP